MKFLNRNLFIKMLMLLLVVVSLGGCKKDDGGDFDGGDEIGSATFTFKGTEYSGNCVQIPATSGASGKIDIVIASSSGSSTFTLYNMPASGSSGSTNITEFTTDSSTSPFALSTINSSSAFLASLSGSATKTGSKSFKFSVRMIDLTTDQESTITGSGSYN